MGRRTVVLAITALAFFSIMAARVVISPLMPLIIPRFGVTKSGIGLALTGMWAAYALTQLPGGMLAERVGERTVVLVALGLTTASSLLLALSPSFRVFALLVFVLGISTGLYYSPSTSIITNFFERQGQALGVHSAAGPFAGLVAPVLAAYLGTRYGWRVGILLGGIVGLPALVLFAVLVPSPRAGGTQGTETAQFSRMGRNVLGFLARPVVLYTILLYSIAEFSFQAFVSFFPVFAVEHIRFSTTEAGLVFGGIFGLSALLMPIMGRLSDAFRYDLALVVSMLGGAVGYLVLVGDFHPWLTGSAILLMGLGLSWGGVLNARSTALFSTANQGTGFGLIRTVSLLLGSLGSVVTGTLSDVIGWSVAFGLVAGLHLVAVLSIICNRVFRLDL